MQIFRSSSFMSAHMKRRTFAFWNCARVTCAALSRALVSIVPSLSNCFKCIWGELKLYAIKIK